MPLKSFNYSPRNVVFLVGDVDKCLDYLDPSRELAELIEEITTRRNKSEDPRIDEWIDTVGESVI